jgi:AmmeMemoRadiSam system protein B
LESGEVFDVITRREPAVAGLFYPADPAVLRHDVALLLRDGPKRATSSPKALIVPHAGYQYSGSVAASAYRHLAGVRDRIERVLLLGPAHRLWLDGLAVPSTDVFATPLGDVAIDTSARERILDLPGVRVGDEAHRQEHCLEVQLPFLQMALQDFRLLPIVVGQCTPATVAAVIDAEWGGDETLIVISSDLSHYHRYDEARRIDARTSRRILNRSTELDGDEACGAAAVNGLMASPRARNLGIELIDLRNSGDTAGDRTRVVGYGAYVLH